MNKLNRFDLVSIGLLLFITIISLMRFNYLPQFVDAYYHLSVANGFISSSGWVGWAWWDFAPLGRPHLYPPLYHLLLVFLQKLSLSGFNSIRITEVVITPLFFFVLWFVLRKIRSSGFAFFCLLALSSFFAFYTSISANIPASLAIIFGLLSWRFISKDKYISAVVFLSLAFYTHFGMPWIFVGSFIVLAVIDKAQRRQVLKVISLSLLLSLPFLYHELRYLSYANITSLPENNYVVFSIFIILVGVISLIFTIGKNKLPIGLFIGYVLFSLIVFCKYPFRFFSAQGVIGLALLSGLVFEKLNKLPQRLIGLSIISFFLFFLHSTYDVETGKINVFNSTATNFIQGKITNNAYFKSLYFPQFYDPIVKIIKERTETCDIIYSNLSFTTQIFSSLTNRLALNPIFCEIKPLSLSFKQSKEDFYNYAKVIIWLKGERGPGLDEKWQKIYENDLANVFLNTQYREVLAIKKARVNFMMISLIFILIGVVLVLDNRKKISF